MLVYSGRIGKLILIFLMLLMLVACVRPNSSDATQTPTVEDITPTLQVEPNVTPVFTPEVYTNIAPATVVYSGVLQRLWPIYATLEFDPEDYVFNNVSFTPEGAVEFCVVRSVADYSALKDLFDNGTAVNITTTTLDAAVGDSAQCKLIREFIPGIENYKQILAVVSIQPVQQ